MVEARLRTAYIRQQSYGPRPYERKHPLPCLTDVFPEVLILLLQPNQGCQRLVIIPLSFILSFIVVRLHPYEQIILTVNYKRKNVGACICLSHSSGLPQPIAKRTNRETPTLEYIDTRKVCVEDSRPSQHTTESIYYTPWSYPCICFCLLFDCGSFERPKTKRQ